MMSSKLQLYQDVAEKEKDHNHLRKEILRTVEYSQQKMEVAAQDRAGWREVVCGLCSTGTEKA